MENMNNKLVGKIFSIDLAALYEHVGNGKTEYGYSIKYSKNCDCEYYDLYGDSVAMFACDGEECLVVDAGNKCITIDNIDCPCKFPFLLSKEEFDIVCH